MKRFSMLLIILFFYLMGIAQDKKFQLYLDYNRNNNSIQFKSAKINDYLQNIDLINLERFSDNFSLNMRYFITDKFGVYLGFSKTERNYVIHYNWDFMTNYNMGILSNYQIPGIKGQPVPPERGIKMSYWEFPLLADLRVLDLKRIKVFHSIGLTSDVYYTNSGYILKSDSITSSWYPENVDYNFKFAHKFLLNATFMVDIDLVIFKWGGINIGGIVNYGITNCLKEPKSSRLNSKQLKIGVFFQ